MVHRLSTCHQSNPSCTVSPAGSVYPSAPLTRPSRGPPRTAVLLTPLARSLPEKRAFFILHNLNVGPQIYELLFASSSERDQ